MTEELLLGAGWNSTGWRPVESWARAHRVMSVGDIEFSDPLPDVDVRTGYWTIWSDAPPAGREISSETLVDGRWETISGAMARLERARRLYGSSTFLSPPLPSIGLRSRAAPMIVFDEVDKFSRDTGSKVDFTWS